MFKTAPPPLTTSAAWRGPSSWLRLLVLIAIGGGLAAPLVVAAVLHWTAREGLAVAEQFLPALRDGDAERVAALLTPEARGTGAGPDAPGARIIQHCSGYLQGGTFSLGGHPYRGTETLTVPFVLRFDQNAAGAATDSGRAAQQPRPVGRPGGGGEVVLRQVGGLWRVSGLHLPATQVSQQGLEFDFERLASDWDAVRGPSSQTVVTNFDQVGPVTPEEFAAAWQTDVDAEDVPAVELLRRLAREAGRPIDSPAAQPAAKLPEDVEEALGRRVSLHLHQVSRFQAMEEVCRQVGVYPDYSRTFPTGQLQFRPGKRPSPVAFAGPFLLEARGVQEDYPNAAGQLQMALYTTALPPKIEALFAALPVYASVQGVTSPAGQSLFFAEKGMPPGAAKFWGPRAPGDFCVTPLRSVQPVNFSVPLKNLIRDVEAIGEMRFGALCAALPREIHSLHLEPVAVGGSTAAGGIRLTLAKITPPPPPALGSPTGLSSFEFRAEPPGGLRLCWLVYHAQGNPVSGWASLSGGPREFVTSVAGEPVRFDFKAWQAAQDVSWDFTLRNVPLSRPPRRLEPARFEGHVAPVRVSEARLTDKGADLRISNDCQKALEEVELKISYRDGEGRVLREAVRKVGQSPGDGVDLSPTRRPGQLPTRPDLEWRVQDPAAVPAGALSLTAAVTRVVFKDGTTWKP